MLFCGWSAVSDYQQIKKTQNKGVWEYLVLLLGI